MLLSMLSKQNGIQFVAFLGRAKDISRLDSKAGHSPTDIYIYIYMIFAGREVRIGKNFAEDRGHSFSQCGPT